MAVICPPFVGVLPIFLLQGCGLTQERFPIGTFTNGLDYYILDIAPDGTHLAVSDGDSVAIWNLREHRQERVLFRGASPSSIQAMGWINASQIVLMSMAADFYLLPSLDVDDSGITACYGPDRVSMKWQQIRSIALVEYKRFGKSGLWTNRELVQIYAICDGENTIAWYANPREKMRQPSSLSLYEYARLLNDQLPALVL